jgi:hypothetical protein
MLIFTREIKTPFAEKNRPLWLPSFALKMAE